jgi:hypothetical protein
MSVREREKAFRYWAKCGLEIKAEPQQLNDIRSLVLPQFRDGLSEFPLLSAGRLFELNIRVKARPIVLFDRKFYVTPEVPFFEKHSILKTRDGKILNEETIYAQGNHLYRVAFRPYLAPLFAAPQDVTDYLMRLP